MDEEEIWVKIEDFPTYVVSDQGRVLNLANEREVAQSLTPDGVIKVGLYKDGKQFTRSLKVLVAEAFVGKTNDRMTTPLHLDNDRLNCRADNLVWRTRSVAWNYVYELSDTESRPWMFTDVVMEVDSDYNVLHIYDNIYEAAVANGVVPSSIVISSINLAPTPTNQYFVLEKRLASITNPLI